jgi:hypothetical protein
VSKWLVVLAVLLVACGGSDDSSDEVLHFDGYDATYRQVQLDLRASLTTSAYGALACSQFNDMKPAEVLDYLERTRKGTPEAVQTPMKGVALKPGQKGDSKSKERAAAILLSECKRLTG